METLELLQMPLDEFDTYYAQAVELYAAELEKAGVSQMRGRRRNLPAGNTAIFLHRGCKRPVQFSHYRDIFSESALYDVYVN